VIRIGRSRTLSATRTNPAVRPGRTHARQRTRVNAACGRFSADNVGFADVSA
jgi:hypothetical protein